MNPVRGPQWYRYHYRERLFSMVEVLFTLNFVGKLKVSYL